ncbi:MAG: adenylate/guanylate cyclase domain-containing protein [Rhodospirillales bacterium]|jgi:adenylate cyclase|nr:adenylate/guanylate cyclase domain-containing protein [Rhodospirillales bacterium]MBT4041553.1 adenylate/guanylate cyclase domain-containing protein [Rhodospirillales bacterium]MBT4627686.1 adenylate/guanylate cyclase domain-containing protein [Rhodospirillales bacterium]MBT5351619.1 adenylate/guanylate cyclase domain-containing protein [Rhodospirillales bacterium]MBT5519268.1 adenylate/guanylate cyclase domain-containing protein [Rhodospirillales bacterium]
MKFLRRAFSFDRLIGLVMLTAFVLTYWADPFPVEFARNKTFDFFEKIQPRPIPAPGTSPVIIIDLDEDSLNEIGQWPWPRNIVADMVRNLFVMGVSVVGFNMVFAEPDRMNPADIADSLAGLDDETKEKLRGLSGNDQAFADILLQTRVVLGQAAYWEELDNAAKGPPVKKSVAMMMTKNGADPKKYIPNVTSLVRNIPVIEQAAAHKFGGHGIFSLVPELDGIVRRVPSLFVYDGEFYPSLSVEMLRLATGRQTIVVKTNVAGIKTMAIAKGMTVPTDKIGRMYPYYSKSDQSKYISARDVLNGTVDPNKIKGKLALVGTSAVGLLDIRSIPTEGIIAGVEVHAQIIENILEQNFLERPNYAQVAELALILVGGLMMIVLVPWFGAKWAAVIFIMIASGAGGTSWYMFTEHRMLFDAVYAVVSILLLYSALTFAGYAREEAQRRQTRDAFSKYLSPDMVAKVAENPDELKLGGESRELTLLFCDVRGFTTISEQFDAVGLTSLINKLLTPLTNVVLAHLGTIDKYMGDCIMAFWNAPLNDEDHQYNGCVSALLMLAEMGPLNERLKEEAEEEGRLHIPLKVGLGLNSGTCVVGNMGSDQRFDYSVLGDPVNLAARLEAQSKNYGMNVVLGPSTNDAVEDRLATIELDFIQVKGKTSGTYIYGLMGDLELKNDPAFINIQTKIREFMETYRSQKFDEALVKLEEIRDLGSDDNRPWILDVNMDVVCDLYVERIAEYKESPPAADWDGVFIATTK